MRDTSPNPLSFFRSVAKRITFQTTFPTSLKQNPNGHDFKISGRSESSVEICTRKYKLEKETKKVRWTSLQVLH